MSESPIDPRSIRESPIAGAWYPGRRDQLSATIAGYLANVPRREIPGEIVALVAPHAGYVYSGQVAAHAYRLLEGSHFDVVAVISPSHRYLASSLAATLKSYYQTPLGLVRVAEDLVEDLAKSLRIGRVARDEEHSLEIQLPFLQIQLGGFYLLPIMMEDQSLPVASRLGQQLARVLAGRSALLVASTDLSHFHSYDRAVALDRVALDDIAAFDPAALDRDINASRTEACGYGAVSAVLTAARALGGDTVTVVNYANSGDVTGDRGRVVGYGAAAVTRASTVAPVPQS